MVIEQVTFDQVSNFAKKAAKERVSITDTKNTEWCQGILDGSVVAIAGLLKVADAYRIKGVYVEKEHRSKGIGEQITLYLMAQCDARCATIDVFAYNPAFYERHGFRRYGVLPNGAVKLRRRY